MANSIGYVGRVIKPRDEKMLARTFVENNDGSYVLNLVIAEDHQIKKGRAKKSRNPVFLEAANDPFNDNKTDDEYIRVTTSWHQVAVLGEKAEAYATDPAFGFGALVEVDGASYFEEAPWKTADGVERAGRPETIGDKRGDIFSKFPPRVEEGKSPEPIWDGLSAVPKNGGGGGGGETRKYNENEGF